MMITLAEFARRCGVSRQAVYKAASPPGSPGDGLFPTHETERGRCVETDDPETREYEQNAIERKRDKPVTVPAPKQVKKPDPVKVTKPKPEKKPKPVAESKPKSAKKTERVEKPEKRDASPPDIPEDIKTLVDGGTLSIETVLNMPKTQLEKLRIYEQMKLIRQNREERRRELVQRRLIRTVFGRLYEIDTTQFLTLKTRIIPGVATAMSRSETVTADMVGKKIEIFTGNQPEAITAADAVIDKECYKILENIKHDVDKFLKQIHEKPLP